MGKTCFPGYPGWFHKPGLFRKTVTEPDDPCFQKSALVFAPHADDETLACGGTIIRKRKAGTLVKVVYTTDSAGLDHPQIDKHALRQMRRSEALAACGKLGVPETDVVFLDFPDGKLRDHLDELAARALAVIKECNPQEVYLPYRRDLHPDHEATHQGVIQACQSSGMKMDTLEYAVWGLYHWPWYSIPLTKDRERKALLKNTLTYFSGLRVTMDYWHAKSIWVAKENLQKIEALSCHKSQMEPIAGFPDWLTLKDVGQGEFLRLHLADFETFIPKSING